MWLIPILAVLLLVGAVALAQTDKLKLAKGITSKIDMSLPFQQQKSCCGRAGQRKASFVPGNGISATVHSWC